MLCNLEKPDTGYLSESVLNILAASARLKPLTAPEMAIEGLLCGVRCQLKQLHFQIENKP